MPTVKRCSSCGNEKPHADFSKSRSAKDGLNVWCKPCASAAYAEWRRKNVEHLKQSKAEYARTNRHIAEAWELANRSTRARQARIRRTANPALLAAHNAKFYAGHKAEARARDAAWRRKNPDRTRAYSHTKKARRASAPGNGISSEQCVALLRDSLGICSYCNGGGELTIDHIEPIAAGGAHDVDNAAVACRSCNSSKRHAPLLLWLARRAA